MKDEGYFVWNPAQNAPRCQHQNKNDAVKEAERLAALNPNQRFIVLRAIGSAIKEAPSLFRATTPDCDGGGDLPF